MKNNAVPIKGWFLVLRGTKGAKSVRFAPPAVVDGLWICGFPQTWADGEPPGKAPIHLIVDRFDGLKILVRPTRSESGIEAVRLDGPPHKDYAAWLEAEHIMLNSADPSASLPILPAEAAGESDDAVDLGADDRPPEARLADTTPLKPKGDPSKKDSAT